MSVNSESVFVCMCLERNENCFSVSEEVNCALTDTFMGSFAFLYEQYGMCVSATIEHNSK